MVCLFGFLARASLALVTPLRHIRIPFAEPEDPSKRTMLKEQEVPGYDKSLYACERTNVRSRDGTTDIPVSIVGQRDVLAGIEEGDGAVTAPTHLYGYGPYGACMEASFWTTRRVLLDEGMVYVIAQ